MRLSLVGIQSGQVYLVEPEEGKESPFVVVPIELTLKIFEELSVKDVVACQLVCKSWCISASDNVLWKRLLGRFHLNFVNSIGRSLSLSKEKYEERYVACHRRYLALMRDVPHRSAHFVRGWETINALGLPEVLAEQMIEARYLRQEELEESLKAWKKNVHEQFEDKAVIAYRPPGGKEHRFCSRESLTVEIDQDLQEDFLEESEKGKSLFMTIFSDKTQATINSDTSSFEEKMDVVRASLAELQVPGMYELTTWTLEEKLSYCLLQLLIFEPRRVIYCDFNRDYSEKLKKLLSLIELLLASGAKPSPTTEETCVHDNPTVDYFAIECAQNSFDSGMFDQARFEQRVDEILYRESVFFGGSALEGVARQALGDTHDAWWYKEVVKILLAYGAKDSSLAWIYGRKDSLLHLAITKKDLEMVILLLECGADIGSVNEQGQSASFLIKQIIKELEISIEALERSNNAEFLVDGVFEFQNQLQKEGVPTGIDDISNEITEKQKFLDRLRPLF